jgi:hypothetical protein
MLFKQEFGPRIVDGSVTMTFRAWSRPQARAGSRQRFGEYDGTREATGFLEIDAVDLVSVASISKAQARRAGFADAASLMEELRRSSRMKLTGDSNVYCVSFRFVRAPDERAQLAQRSSLSAQERAALAERLRRLDVRSDRGPWTDAILRLIAEQTGVPASVLAKKVGYERDAFKANVRKLKALGLTISLEKGYRISPRGMALLRRGVTHGP